VEEPRRHEPVLLEESLGLLLRPESRVIADATLGAAGHAEAILRRSPEAVLYGFDRDQSAIETARRRLAPFGSRAVLLHADYRAMREELKKTASSGWTGSSSISAFPRCSSTIRSAGSRSARTVLWT